MPPYELPTNLPDRSISRNPFIDKTRIWTKELGALCVCCAKCGHNNKQCTDGYLPAWETAYLKEIVFGDQPQVSFIQLGHGKQDHNTTLFDCHHTHLTIPRAQILFQLDGMKSPALRPNSPQCQWTHFTVKVQDQIKGHISKMILGQNRSTILSRRE